MSGGYTPRQARLSARNQSPATKALEAGLQKGGVRRETAEGRSQWATANSSTGVRGPHRSITRFIPGITTYLGIAGVVHVQTKTGLSNMPTPWRSQVADQPVPTQTRPSCVELFYTWQSKSCLPRRLAQKQEGNQEEEKRGGGRWGRATRGTPQ